MFKYILKLVKIYKNQKNDVIRLYFCQKYALFLKNKHIYVHDGSPNINLIGLFRGQKYTALTIKDINLNFKDKINQNYRLKNFLIGEQTLQKNQ